MTFGEASTPPSRSNAAVRVRAVRVNGVELHYTDSGADSATVVLLHGGMGDLESWPHQWRALSDRYRVIAYSRRYSHPNRNITNHARRGHHVDDDIEDLLALQAALDTGPSHLVATSYGALLALAVALRAPSQAASLVLVEPPLHSWVRETETGERLYNEFFRGVWQAAGEAFRHGLPRRAMQLLTEGMWGRPVLDSWSDDRVDAVMRNAAAMHELIKTSEPFPDFERSAVSRLWIPTLLLQGEHTSALHQLVMNELSQVMGNAKRIEIPNAGHASPNENPETFNAAIVSFLEAQPLPSKGMR